MQTFQCSYKKRCFLIFHGSVVTHARWSETFRHFGSLKCAIHNSLLVNLVQKLSKSFNVCKKLLQNVYWHVFYGPRWFLDVLSSVWAWSELGGWAVRCGWPTGWGGDQVSQTTTVAIVAVNVSVLRATTALISAKCFDAEAAKQYCQLNCRTTGVVWMYGGGLENSLSSDWRTRWTWQLHYRPLMPDLPEGLLLDYTRGLNTVRY